MKNYEPLFYSWDEFDCPSLPGSGVNMDIEFVKLLDELRAKFGKPIKINSGFRTMEHNASLKNSSPNSSHLKGLAVDIHCNNSIDRYELIRLAMELDLRIGCGKSFLHIDNDKTKAQKVLWTY
jgi:uncharacterized protein YcbK (DUF882 family)